MIEEAIHAGQRVFGESYVQEAKLKIPALRERYSQLEFHLIGRLQRNKVKDALRLFDVIQSIDSMRLADEVARCASSLGKFQRVMVQVNVSGESQKGGVPPEEVLDLVRYIAELKVLRVEGLMMIGSPPESGRSESEFQRMAGLKHDLERAGFPIAQLSMGMSEDFGLAIRCGSNMVRIGSRIFGER
jgi:pyridoxal phosphate enzyme (YggS family)